MEICIENNYMFFLKSLKLLSLPYEDQQKHLPDYVFVPSEVVCTFEDAFLLLPQLIENGMFTNISIANILRTYNIVTWTEINVGLDYFSSVQWNKVRFFAKESLQSIGIEAERIELGSM